MFGANVFDSAHHQSKQQTEIFGKNSAASRVTKLGLSVIILGHIVILI